MNPELLVLVPLLLLPVVGLLAFAGCAPFESSSEAPPQTPPPPPIILIPLPRPSYSDEVQGTIGLVAHWRLGDPEGSVVARDEGPHGLNGRYVDGPPDVQRSKPGGALAPRDPQDRCAGFPGEAGHVVVDHSPRLNVGSGLRFSFEVWARLRDPGARVGDSEHLASSRLFDLSGPNAGWDLFVTYGTGGLPTFTARVFSGDGLAATEAEVLAQSATTSPDGAWHHVVLTYDGTGDGTLAVSVRLAGEAQLFRREVVGAPYAPNPTVDLLLGAATTITPFNLFEGDLDEAAFYDAALTTTQIEDHHKAAIATPP